MHTLKPLDRATVLDAARNSSALITVEEGAVGGFGSHVLQFLATNGLLDHGLKVRPLCLPDEYTDHAKPERMYELAGLDSGGIVKAVFAALGDKLRRPARA